MDCSICHCDIDDKDKLITNCKHIYHKECLEKWFKISHRCPLCRESKFNISIEEYEKNYWKRQKELEKEIDSIINSYNLSCFVFKI